MTFRIEITWQVTWWVLILTSTFTFSKHNFAPPNRQCHRYKWKDIVATRIYVTWKIYFHSLIWTQFRLSNLSVDYLLVKAWGLPPLGATVDSEVEKLMECNWPPPFVMRHQLFHSIAKVIARWQKPKTGRPMATRLDGCTSWKLWFRYIIGCMRARLERVKSEVDKSVYLVYWRYISGIKYWASNDEGLG